MQYKLKKIRKGQLQANGDQYIIDVVVDGQPKKLSVIPKQNRPIRKGWVRTLTKTWDADLANQITINVRKDGTWFVAIGQHRVLSAPEGFEFDVRVYSGLTRPQESHLWVGEADCKQPSPWDKFQHRLVEGDPIATGVQEVFNTLGMDVPKSIALKAVEDAYEDQLLGVTLNVLKESYPDHFTPKGALNRATIGGVHRLLKKYNGSVNQEHLVKALKQLPVRGTDSVFTECRKFLGGSTDVAIGARSYLVTRYNRGLKKGGPNRLPVPE